MRIAILANADSWYLSDLRRAAAGRHEIVAVAFRDLVSSIGDGAVRLAAAGADLAAADAVLVRSMPPGSLEQIVFRMDALARLEAAGVPVMPIRRGRSRRRWTSFWRRPGWPRQVCECRG